MATSRQDVIDNKVINANLGAISIDNELATTMAEAFLQNHSIQSISFKMSDLDDEGLLIIKNALVQRNRKLVELNLDTTNITPKSMDTLIDLMNKKLVLRLYLFNIDEIYDNPANKKILSDCAKENKVYISFEPASKRQAIDTFFDRHTDEQKDPSQVSSKSPTENELKQMHDPLNNSFK